MEEKDLYAEISSIRTLMERSTKFISLSGLSGVLAGIYALIGAVIAYNLITINNDFKPFSDPDYGQALLIKLVILALVVLVLAISTGVLLTIRKARAKGENAWNQSSKLLLRNGILPLITGGIFVIILLIKGFIGVIAPGCLIFYGLSLVAASNYTYGDVKWLGIFEIVLGLIAALLPGYGLFFWAAGFGVLHIIYGAVMYFKYDRENSAG
ncbi:hypothetical protein GS399_12670 [Pedobacter sp. HMF7647]|uniref:DUF973 family protein n=1 Tax=Hufsiella arboris TaxID=2695275 RepID=A0A7K1YBT7_9SPHI|nr:hypothetical protein [Hufsiella arboris]MXV51831.1 hypothetical protein [Hufsiella arboris]